MAQAVQHKPRPLILAHKPGQVNDESHGLTFAVSRHWPTRKAVPEAPVTILFSLGQKL